MQDCCFRGFQWDGTPKGKEDTLAGQKTYVTGDDKTHAILIGHDAIGWAWKNTRLLADHFAKEVGATVYLPDFFDGESIDANDISIKFNDEGKAVIDMLNKDFDFPGWIAKNNQDLRLPQILDFAKELRKQYSWLGFVGYCWGGGVGFKIASKEHSSLFDCITVAHPSTPSEGEVKSISVPFQIIAPEHDPTFEADAKELCQREIPKLGVPYLYYHFPGMLHGFATKCDESKASEKRALEAAKNAVVFWMTAHRGEK